MNIPLSTIECAAIAAKVEALSREIGTWMLHQRVDEGMADIKSPNNLVTFVDKESERRFVEGLSAIFPKAGFVAEEGTGVKSENGFNWVIDPLDGTTNFVHGVPVWCTSIALAYRHRAIVGVIFDPSRNEMFTASLGNGATMNGKTIRVSAVNDLQASLLATGFPYDDFGRQDAYMGLFKELMKATRGMRRLGSAALDMAWTANGRFEGFYEYGLNPWDVAAGAIIVEEAGGNVTEFNGGDNAIFGEDVNCTNGHLHQALAAIIRRYFT
jgi:myo-inositol-1(or 4)-monophosphatase